MALQLVARGLNDVICAFHLAVHGYLNQAYGMMRMAYEASEIVEREDGARKVRVRTAVVA